MINRIKRLLIFFICLLIPGLTNGIGPERNTLPVIISLLLEEEQVDNTAPTVPTGLSVQPVSWEQINLSWTASTDNVGVAGYKIYSGSGVYITSVTTTWASITGLNPNTTYCYSVSAYDAQENESAQSAQQCATTLIKTETITLKPQYDNAVIINSLDGSVANTVYQNYTLPVGCNWNYIYIPWPADLWSQEFVCYQSLVWFNLNAVAGKTIDNATLRLTTSSIGVGIRPRQWHVRAMSTSWSPFTVTWNVVENSNYHLNSEIVLYPPGYFGQSELFEINVTGTVQNWVSGTWNNYGLIFGSEDYIFPYLTTWDAFEFYSLEDPGQDWPKLTIVYH